MAEMIDRMLGRYKIIKQLGEGGMGAVFKAQDITLQRDVAIKVLHPHLLQQANLKERFLQEARSAAKLDHPGIVKVYDFGKEGSVLYIVMEFILGVSLHQLLRDLEAGKKWIVLDEAVGLTREVCLALDHAHRHGVLHRDIKPANIMLKPEPSNELPYRPVLTDLGLAKLLEGQALTQEGTSMGTPAYMSPEQAMGRTTDRRSDVYSLGILLYELAVGRLPFPARTITEAIRFHTKEDPPPPRSIRPDLPVFLERVILRALTKNPAKRFPDSATMAQALAAIAPSIAEIAATTVVEGSVSLATQIQETMVDESTPPVRDEHPTPPPDLAQDSIQIVGADGTTRLIPLKAGGMTIGRAEDNELVLDDSIVSSHHARVDARGRTYSLIDLNSRNGTFLRNTRLLPGTPEEWTPKVPVRMGRTWLRLLRSEYSTPPVPVKESVTEMYHPGGSRIEPSLIRTSPKDGRVSVFMENPKLTVVPGSSTTASILILNRGSLVDNFKISVHRIPPDWIPSSPPAVRLMPEDQGEVSFSIHPPRSPRSRAGTYPVIIRVRSVAAPDQVVDIDAELTIEPYYQFSSVLHPQRLRPGKRGAVKVENLGNIEQSFALTLSDRGDELSFQPSEAKIAAAAGEEVQISFRTVLRQRRWVGSENVHPFSAEITPPEGIAQTHSGEVLSRALIPAWALPLLLFACIALAAAAAFGYREWQDQTGDTTRVAQTEDAAQALAFAATQTATVEFGLALDSDGDGIPDVQESELGTDPTKSDSDEDGLSDQEEITAGTEPDNADTDGDGLSDGDEKLYGADPHVLDTDGDSLPDGVEVHGRQVGEQIFHTNPINKDSDGDGLLDNVDPDPGHLPTPVPTATPTPTSTSIPTPTFTPESTATPTPTPSAQDDYEVITLPNSRDDSKTDVFLRDSNRGEETLFITLEDVYREHYHNSEYHNGNLYIIRRVGYDGYPDEEWSDELWRYDSQTRETRLFSAKGLDFRTAPNENHIALVYSLDGSGEPSDLRLAFLNSRGDLVQEFTVDQLSSPDYPSPLKWSDDSGEFWGASHMGPRVLAFHRVEVVSWSIDGYDVSRLPISSEYDLNANIGKLVYSDYPVMFDVESVKQFEASGQQVTLFVYDFDTRAPLTIASSIAKLFHPIWLDDSTIECDDPAGEGRIVYTVR